MIKYHKNLCKKINYNYYKIRIITSIKKNFKIYRIKTYKLTVVI